MKHRQSRYQLNRFTSWRKATELSLARNLLIHQSIKTTKIKAKAVKPFIEKLISLGKDNSLAAKRRAYSMLCDHSLVSLLFNDIAPRFAKRSGGYTRILSLGLRRGDSAEVVLLELTEIKKKESKSPKKAKHIDEHGAKLAAGAAIAEEAQGQPEAQEKHKQEEHVKEKPPVTRKPPKKFLGCIKNIFKKERDSL